MGLASVFILTSLASLMGGQVSGSNPISEKDDFSRFFTERYSFIQHIVTDTNDVPAITVFTNYAQATGNEWTYIIDSTGNQIFRPTVLSSHMKPSFKSRPVKRDKVYNVPIPIRKKLLNQTIDYAKQLTGADMSWHVLTTMKREILLRSECGKAVPFHKGRYLVRLSNHNFTHHFQVLFDHENNPLRIDTNIQNSSSKQLTELFHCYNGARSVYNNHSEPLALGTFYDSDEFRFKVNASSYDSKAFLDLKTTENPFGRHNPGPLKYFESEDYKHWCWHWWVVNGKMNGIRGNWNKETQSWQYPEAEVKFVNSLNDYDVVDSQSLTMKDGKRPNGEPFQYPFGVVRHMPDRFHRDMESCNVVVICTHGGAFSDRVQLRKCFDVWFALGREEHKLGNGNLRHLFIHGCSVMNCFKDRTGQALTREWMAGLYIDGINTVCGTDGNHDALDRGGWRFFRRYNTGDSISEAWAFALIDESLSNAPVTVAYGETLDQAVESLFDGRFSTKRIIPNYSAASLWYCLDTSKIKD